MNTAESFFKIVRINDMIANPKSFDRFINSPFSTKGNVKRRILRICILMLGYKGLK